MVFLTFLLACAPARRDPPRASLTRNVREVARRDRGEPHLITHRALQVNWRKSQMSPVMELAWLLVGSMVAWHFKSKFFGPPAASVTPPAPQQAPPTEAQGARSRASSRSQARSARPILRPPSALFGI